MTESYGSQAVLALCSCMQVVDQFGFAPDCRFDIRCQTSEKSLDAWVSETREEFAGFC